MIMKELDQNVIAQINDTLVQLQDSPKRSSGRQKKLTAKAQALQKPSKKITLKKTTPKKKGGNLKPQVSTMKTMTDVSLSITPPVDKGGGSGLGVTSMVSEPAPVASLGHDPPAPIIETKCIMCDESISIDEILEQCTYWITMMVYYDTPSL